MQEAYQAWTTVKVAKSACKLLVSPLRNPVQNLSHDAQIAFYKIPVKRRQLQRKLKEYTKSGQIDRYAFIKKNISCINKRERMSYGK